MAANERYPAVPAARPQAPAPAGAHDALAAPAIVAPAADLVARIEELERMVATLSALAPERPAPPDPVALTAALHAGGGFRSRRDRRSSDDGTIGLRFVLFDGTRPG